MLRHAAKSLKASSPAANPVPRWRVSTTTSANQLCRASAHQLDAPPRSDCARRKCRRHQRPLLLLAPAPAPLRAGLSNIELGRRLGISSNAAWRVQHKLMQAMLDRDRRYKLGAAGPRIEIDDAYVGGERSGEAGRRLSHSHSRALSTAQAWPRAATV
jgi:hypothetical protein